MPTEPNVVAHRGAKLGTAGFADDVQVAGWVDVLRVERPRDDLVMQ
jgi:hypothetical protein